MRSYARYLLNNIGKGGAISHCLNQMRALETLEESYTKGTKKAYCPLCICCSTFDDDDNDYGDPDCRLCLWAIDVHDAYDPDENKDNYDLFFNLSCLRAFNRSFFTGNDDDLGLLRKRLRLFPIQKKQLEGVLAYVNRR